MARLPNKVMAKKRGRFQSERKNDKKMLKGCKLIKDDKIEKGRKKYDHS